MPTAVIKSASQVTKDSTQNAGSDSSRESSKIVPQNSVKHVAAAMWGAVSRAFSKKFLTPISNSLDEKQSDAEADTMDGKNGPEGDEEEATQDQNLVETISITGGVVVDRSVDAADVSISPSCTVPTSAPLGLEAAAVTDSTNTEKQSEAEVDMKNAKNDSTVEGHDGDVTQSPMGVGVSGGVADRPINLAIECGSNPISTPLDVDAKSENIGANGTLAVLNSVEKQVEAKVDTANDTKSGSAVDVGDEEVTHDLRLDKKVLVQSDVAEYRHVDLANASRHISTPLDLEHRSEMASYENRKVDHASNRNVRSPSSTANEQHKTEKGTAENENDPVVNGGIGEVKSNLNTIESDGVVYSSAVPSNASRLTLRTLAPTPLDLDAKPEKINRAFDADLYSNCKASCSMKSDPSKFDCRTAKLGIVPEKLSAELHAATKPSSKTSSKPPTMSKKRSGPRLCNNKNSKLRKTVVDSIIRPNIHTVASGTADTAHTKAKRKSTTPQQPQEQTVKLVDAISYLDQIKTKFCDRPQIFAEFIHITNLFRNEDIDQRGVANRVGALFRGNSDLIRGFNVFMPAEHKIKVNDPEPASLLRASIENTFSTSSISKRAVFSKDQDLQLWEGYKAHGKQWKQISELYFDSALTGTQLSRRWRTSVFKKNIESKFGAGVCIESTNECMEAQLAGKSTKSDAQVSLNEKKRTNANSSTQTNRPANKKHASVVITGETDCKKAAICHTSGSTYGSKTISTTTATTTTNKKGGSALVQGHNSTKKQGMISDVGHLNSLPLVYQVKHQSECPPESDAQVSLNEKKRTNANSSTQTNRTANKKHASVLITGETDCKKAAICHTSGSTYGSKTISTTTATTTTNKMGGSALVQGHSSTKKQGMISDVGHLNSLPLVYQVKHQSECPPELDQDLTPLAVLNNHHFHHAEQSSKKEIRPSSNNKKDWSREEDHLLLETLKGAVKSKRIQWCKLARHFPGRSKEELRKRWINYLNPQINNFPFSREDDLRLWEGYRSLGRQWAKISVEHFNSTRTNTQLSKRWSNLSFQEFVANEFGNDVKKTPTNSVTYPQCEPKAFSKSDNLISKVGTLDNGVPSIWAKPSITMPTLKPAKKNGSDSESLCARVGAMANQDVVKLKVKGSSASSSSNNREISIAALKPGPNQISSKLEADPKDGVLDAPIKTVHQVYKGPDGHKDLGRMWLEMSASNFESTQTKDQFIRQFRTSSFNKVIENKVESKIFEKRSKNVGAACIDDAKLKSSASASIIAPAAYDSRRISNYQKTFPLQFNTSLVMDEMKATGTPTPDTLKNSKRLSDTGKRKLKSDNDALPISSQKEIKSYNRNKNTIASPAGAQTLNNIQCNMHLLTKDAQGFDVRTKQSRVKSKQTGDRCTNNIKPQVSRSRFSREEDLRLWKGHQDLGDRWKDISVNYFDSARTGHSLMQRFIAPSFKERMKKEVDQDVFAVEETKNAQGIEAKNAPFFSAKITRVDHLNLKTQAMPTLEPAKKTSGDSESLCARVGATANQDAGKTKVKGSSTSSSSNKKEISTATLSTSVNQENNSNSGIECKPSGLAMSKIKPKRPPSSSREKHASQYPCCHGKEDDEWLIDEDTAVGGKSRRKVKNCVRTTTKWTEDEDHIVIKAMSNSLEGEAIKWNELLGQLPDRKKSHVQNRWNLQLKPALIHTPFTDEEDLLLYRGVAALGKQWVEISVKYFNSTRSNEYLRTRWPTTKKKMERKDKIDSSRLESEDFNLESTTFTTESIAEDTQGTTISKRKADLEHYKSARKNPRRTATTLMKTYDENYINICYDFVSSERTTTKNNSQYAIAKTIPDSDDDVAFGQLSCDILHHIASFLESLQALASFCSVSKETNFLLKHSNHSESLLHGLFLKKFQGANKHFKHLTWREQWIRMSKFRNGFGKIGSPLETTCTVWPTSLGLLPTQVEESAIFYDNPIYDTPENDHSHGYFGMQILNNLPPPPNAREWEAPLIIHGDFNGVRICKSVSDVINLSGSIVEDRFLSLGHDEDGGQVLSLMLSPSDLLSTLYHNDEVVGPPCCFVGYASGRVAALHATLTEDRARYTFTMTEHHAHICEVTSLAVVNSKSFEGNPCPVLFSACCGGDVYYYPHAMSKENSYSMQAVPAFSNVNNCPIFSMTSTQIQVHTGGDESCIVLVIGDQSGNVSLWSIHKDAFICGPAPKDSFSRIGVVKGGRGKHPVTTTKIMHGNILVSGNTNGDIRFWSIESVLKPKKGLVPQFILRQDRCGAHSGSVEVCMNIGDVLLTSGGNDGKLVGWDTSCNRIGALSCHPGRKTLVPDTRNRRTMKCCVISAILPSTREGRLVSLCRDGVLAYWAFDAS